MGYGSPAEPPGEAQLSRDRGESCIPQRDGQPWSYPSPAQFHAATKAKGHSVAEEQIPLIVEIHNAVNDEAWRRIVSWEARFHPDCKDIRLVRFVGRPGERSPKSLLLEIFAGRRAPFDRHDWLIDRCGQAQIRYVVDFYDGNLPSGQVGVPICIDARPALDSVALAVERLKKYFLGL